MVEENKGRVHLPEGFKRIDIITNVTFQLIERIQALLDKKRFVLINLREVFDTFWKGSSGDLPIGIQVDEKILSDRNIQTHPFKPGLSRTPPTTNTKSWTVARSIFLGGKRYIKGIGRRKFEFDYGRSAKPFRIARVTALEVFMEIRMGLIIVDLYTRVFGRKPAIRLPKYIVELSYEPTSPETQKVYQVEYEVETPVRSVHCYYISDLARLWTNIDLSTDDGKREAVRELNQLLTAYPSQYQNGHTVVGLSYEDIIDSADSGNSNIFELIEMQQRAIQGGEEVKYSQEDILLQARLRLEIKLEGYRLARVFYSKNEKLVDRTIDGEVRKLAKVVGMSVAVGIDLGESVDCKDTYGGMISDIDSVIELFANIKGETQRKEGMARLGDVVDKSMSSVLYLSAMFGLNSEEQIDIVKRYLAYVSLAFEATIQKLDELPFSQEYKTCLNRFYKELLGNYQVSLQEANSRSEAYFHLLIRNNSYLMQGRWDISPGSNDFSFRFDLYRRMTQKPDDLLAVKNNVERPIQTALGLSTEDMEDKLVFWIDSQEIRKLQIEEKQRE